MKRLFAVATTMLFALCLAQAQTQPDPPQRGNRGRGAEQQPQTTPPTATGQTGQQRPAPPPEEKSSVTRSSVRIGGQQINYTATAANYIIKADDGTPKASFFFVAYTKDDAPTSPISFIST
jgi:carboxypeptidase C (cathepsin A)